MGSFQTVIETGIFTSKVSKVWAPSDYEEFIVYIATHPRAGEVVADSGGVSIIYFNSSSKVTWLLAL
jgi:hypothetical protein